MRTRLERMNFESECFYDVSTGNGFLITDVPFSDADKSIRNPGGPRSPLYGTTYNDAGEFLDRYRCTCGQHVGAAFEHEICKICNTPIKFTDVNIKYTGWLNFYPYKIINPLYYKKLQSALSKRVLEEIISNENIITSNGQIRKHSDVISVKKSTLQYHNIGLKEFYENFVEIMEFYKVKRKAKADLIDELIEDRYKLWTSKLPVLSTVLRPQGGMLRPISHHCREFSKVNTTAVA